MALELETLSKTLGGVRAVQDVTLSIVDGEFLSLLGPSGCGKTTTLRLLAGFLTPDAGRILAGAQVLSDPRGVVAPERRGMSMIFQSYAVWPHKTVFDNIAFGLRLRKCSRADVERRTGRMLELVRLEGLRDRYPGELSGGQQQRVALARALVVEPSILLLDEPLSNLDATLRDEMRFEIRRLHEEMGITSVYVTHDQAEAMVTSDRIAVMHGGRIEQVGSPQDIYERPRTEFVASFIGQTNCLRGIVKDDEVVDCGGVALRVATCRPMGSGARVVVSVRPHAIALSGAGPEPTASANGVNVLEGRVMRQAYLGGHRDYLVRVTESDLTVRVVTDAARAYERGERVTLSIPRTACRVIAT